MVEQGPGVVEQENGEVEQGRDVTIEGGRWSTNTAGQAGAGITL